MTGVWNNFWVTVEYFFDGKPVRVSEKFWGMLEDVGKLALDKIEAAHREKLGSEYDSSRFKFKKIEITPA